MRLQEKGFLDLRVSGGVFVGIGQKLDAGTLRVPTFVRGFLHASSARGSALLTADPLPCLLAMRVAVGDKLSEMGGGKLGNGCPTAVPMASFRGVCLACGHIYNNAPQDAPSGCTECWNKSVVACSDAFQSSGGMAIPLRQRVGDCGACSTMVA